MADLIPLDPSTPAGWYADPRGVGVARYWDGRWTNKVSDSETPLPLPAGYPPLARAGASQAGNAGVVQMKTPQLAAPKPIATFAPSFRSIKLFADGRIVYHDQVGSIVGASARVDASGSKRVFRDTREVFLMIEGPRVSIAAPLGSKGHLLQTQARKFAAKVNELAMRLGESSAAPTMPPTQGATSNADAVLDRLERLGKLRDSGVLTEDEFQAQKSALLQAETGSSDTPALWDVVLLAAGPTRIQVMKAVLAATAIGLKASKALVDSSDGAPAVVRAGLSRDDAEMLKVTLETAGAVVELQAR